MHPDFIPCVIYRLDLPHICLVRQVTLASSQDPEARRIAADTFAYPDSQRHVDRRDISEQSCQNRRGLLLNFFLCGNEYIVVSPQSSPHYICSAP